MSSRIVSGECSFSISMPVSCEQVKVSHSTESYVRHFCELTSTCITIVYDHIMDKNQIKWPLMPKLFPFTKNAFKQNTD